MKNSNFPILTIHTIAFLEISIGLVTMAGLTFHALFYTYQKSYSVTVFVILSAIVSTSLGCSLLKFKEWARHLLVFFSGYVVITKILLFTNILILRGEIITTPPSWIKNSISVLYHIAVIVILENKLFKKEFNKEL